MDLVTDFRTWGGVHTASYFAQEDVRPNEATREIITDFRHTSREGTAGTGFKYNPNKGIRGECTSMEDYHRLLAFCCSALELKTTPKLTRIDFHVDCVADTREQYHYWQKLGEWAVSSFAYMKHVRPRREMRAESFTTGTHQKTEAVTDGFEVSCYNKAQQKPDEGVGYRFEIRHKTRKDTTEEEALRKLCHLLKRLPDYAEMATEAQNAMLLERWNSTAPLDGSPRRANEFINAHEHYFMTTQQLQHFYEAIGCTRKQAYRAKRNYCHRYKHVFMPVTLEALKAFCDMAVSYIENYLDESTAEDVPA